MATPCQQYRFAARDVSPRQALLLGLFAASLAGACSPDGFSPDKAPLSTPDAIRCEDSFRIDSFQASPTTGTAPLSVTFTANIADPSAACGETSFGWVVDGAASGPTTDPTVTHTFFQPGTYEVAVTAYTQFTSLTTGVTLSVDVHDGEMRPPELPVHLYVATYDASSPTTLFTYGSNVFVEPILENPNDVPVSCWRGYTLPPWVIFEIYAGDSMVTDTSYDYPALTSEEKISFLPGETSLPTADGLAFELDPGTFEVYAYLDFDCVVPVYSEPTTVVVTE